MDDDATLDKDLAETLDPKTGDTLARWADAQRLRFGDPFWFSNGRSGALVAAVDEHDRAVRSTRRLVLKYEPPGGTNEYGRLKDAWAGAPAFAKRHLPRLHHDPIPIGDDGWILFQELAGADLEEYAVLTTLLAGVARSRVVARDGRPPVSCDRGTFARVCAAVTTSILGDLAREPYVDTQPAAEFLRSHFADRIAPGAKLITMAGDHPELYLHLQGESQPLPNPYRFVLDPPPFLTAEIRALTGRAHGDLHTENILVRCHPRIEGDDFYLVDLARYNGNAPLTADPAQLVLSIVNRTMDELASPQLDVLIDVLVAGTASDEALLPGWLTDLLRLQHEAAAAWLKPRGLWQEWRQLLPFSLLAGALIFRTRSTTTPAARAWFLRLAARAAAAVQERLGSQPPPVHRWLVPHESTVESSAGPVEDGRQDLCRELPDFRAVAIQRGRLGDLDALINRAKAGLAVRDEFATLKREVYGDEDEQGSRNIPGRGVGRPGRPEYFTCPLSVACRRSELRLPSTGAPICGILDQPMIAHW